MSYLPLWEPVGATVAADVGGRGYNGAPTAVTFGAAGIGDGRTAGSFNGTSSTINWYSAPFAAAVNTSDWSLLMWVRALNAATWTDATFPVLAMIQADINNLFYIQKVGAAQVISATSVAGATSRAVATPTVSQLGWFHVGVTKLGTTELKMYYNGVQNGATIGTLGTWAGAVASATIGSSVTPALFWPGYLAHVVLLNRVATAAEMVVAAQVP